MGRKKQQPHRCLGPHLNAGVEVNAERVSTSTSGQNNQSVTIEESFYVEIDRSNWDSNEHFDISEVVLTNLNIKPDISAGCREANLLLRCRLCNVNEFVGRFKLGHWPLIPASDIYLEFTENAVDSIVVSGNFDGPDEGVTGLVHLLSLKFLTIRPIDGFTLSENMASIRVRVEILKKAFEACDSLLDTTRQLWKKSMMSVMAWLRPEITTSEVLYGCNESIRVDDDTEDVFPRKRAKFDAAGFCEAIKPSKTEPMLEDEIPDLLPELRPYQRRAVYWMVQREKGSVPSGVNEINKLLSPLCRPVDLIDTSATLYYNPFSGTIAKQPESSSPYVFGGILADEMGLGKTVELLACVFAHRKSEAKDGKSIVNPSQIPENRNGRLKRLKRERVECICGAVTESFRYKGLWVQCDVCDAWQHADCVNYSVRGRSAKSKKSCSGKQGNNEMTETDRTKRRTKRKNDTKIVVMDEDHICQFCSELMEANVAPVASGATLIVCPSPILSQWHSEIIRHTRPNSLKTYIYEGVRNASLANIAMMDISELTNSDIVLTTYDVLKDDLSHDSDRYDGDRRFMRFQKRYPVIPTPLTRIDWWRVCLDEAQMVESTTASATEMALRLHAKNHWCITGTPIQKKLDDLFGLLKFLKATPFDVFKWWVEVIRDPYEREDAGAVRFTHDFFRTIMWRSSKAHVSDELQLPPQEECLTWLSLSPIEEHFYQRQHDTCVSDANEVIESFTGSTSSGAKPDFYITHVEAAKLFNSLLKLRQACCHPQVGSSGLRSLQQSPMSMEDILSVLVGKTKVEGEEALRKAVSALNGLAGIALIKQEFTQAISLYKEALVLAKEHSSSFRLDPLQNIHIHHNLVEILSLTPEYSDHIDLNEGKECDKPNMDMNDYSNNHAQVRFFTDVCLRTKCEDLKQKFLSVFNSRLSLVQQEFYKLHVQVCDALNGRKKRKIVWWLDALHHVEQNKDSSSELFKKIGEAISSSLNSSRKSRIPSSFRSITGLTYYIQTGLDALEDSRKILLAKLLEIDQTMANPREEDIGRVRYCSNCHANKEGPICVHCEMDELFQVYEARLFRHNKEHNGGIIASAEEAVNLQKKKSALNRFLRDLSKHDKSSTSSSANDEENGGKRDAMENVMILKSPSELEVVLGIIKSFSKALLGQTGFAEAAKHLLLLEGMRKEYAQARSLASSQAQMLLAHDEMKMATSRLRLWDNNDDAEKPIDAFRYGELDAGTADNLSDKFMALASLSRIKGQLRYLQGLVQSKENKEENKSSYSPPSNGVAASTSTTEKGSGVKGVEETCPICQEKLINRKIVFQCGHLTCCKCFFALTEQRLAQHGNSLDNWVMCPTCRQHTEFGNIAVADDEQKKTEVPFKGGGNSEESIIVQGSYGTKIEAITRRILWITSEDPSAKLLVFSSWIDVLDVLEHAFVTNNISCIRMKGGRKAHVSISQFKAEKCSSSAKKDKSKKHGRCQVSEIKHVQVLLLLIQHGANGLNLLEAQHVILVEPLLNPAAEAQAVGRVHRIGQKNNTLVHRFIVKNTVEESIHKLNRSRSTSSFISRNKRNQDEPVLTVKDIESLLMTKTPSTVQDQTHGNSGENLMHLPPSVASALAAERRLAESKERT